MAVAGEAQGAGGGREDEPPVGETTDDEGRITEGMLMLSSTPVITRRGLFMCVSYLTRTFLPFMM